jgi:hypothetical protein
MVHKCRKICHRSQDLQKNILYLPRFRLTDKKLPKMAVKTKNKALNTIAGTKVFVNVQIHFFGLLSYKNV